jgi:FkbM family methyltransferase
MKTLYHRFTPAVRVVLRILFLENIFYKLFYRRYYYGQDGEDVMMRLFFDIHRGGRLEKYKGFYIDIGAFDPAHLSNTKYFYDHGWSGINIDANPVSINIFKRLRKRDVNINCGVAGKEGVLDYYYLGPYSMMNTFDKALYDHWLSRGIKPGKIMKIEVKSINSILEKHLPIGQRIDFISMDVEGFEWEILQTFDFEKYAPRYFLIEDLDYGSDKDFMEYRNTETCKFMYKNGYMIAGKTPKTVVYKNVQI